MLEVYGPGAAETTAAAVDEGVAWLDEALGALLAVPFQDQARGPLEVFQESMRFPTEALLAAGVQQPRRDEAVAAALPGDLYDLAPASSQDLGEEVWAAHIAWGAAKARAFRPSVVLLSRDLMDRSKVEPVVIEAGFRLIVWRDASVMDLEAGRPVVALVDDLPATGTRHLLPDDKVEPEEAGLKLSAEEATPFVKDGVRFSSLFRPA